jgi:aspartate aminotransferase
MCHLGGLCVDPMTIPHSATLAIDEVVEARRRAGRSVLHLGFGEAGLPVPPGLSAALAGATDLNSYGPVAGSSRVRTAAACWFTRRGVHTDADQIVMAPGSKPLLFALLAAIGGDVVLPRPSWVSYAAQAALLNRPVISVPIPAQCGGVPDPDRLEHALRQAVRAGAHPRVLVLTIPDNPTGTVAPGALVKRVCQIADGHGLGIVCDEIYADLCHLGAPPSAVTYLPERTVVTSGLSKSLALGGWRIGYARTPDSDWGRQVRRDVVGVASEVWSSLAAPMQAVAAHVLDGPPELAAHIDASRRLHARVASAVYDAFDDARLPCRPPQAGFYLYPDFRPFEHVLADRGITTSTQLATSLLDQHGVAVLPGAAFGDPDPVLTVRVATSLLYGTTGEQRWTALRSQAPETLPWIANAIMRLRVELGRFTGRPVVG